MRILLLALMGSALGAIFVITRAGYVDPAGIVEFLRSHPRMAPAVFVLAYAVLTVALAPTVPLNLAAGFLWGTVVGTGLTVLGVTSGALVAFVASRYVLRDRVAARLTGQPWRWLDTEIREKGWRAVAFTRINPIFPSGLLNWFFGVSAIPLSTFLWATAVFIIPPALAMAAIGASAGSIVLNGESAAMVRQIAIASAAVTTIVVARLLLRRAQKQRDLPAVR